MYLASTVGASRSIASIFTLVIGIWKERITMSEVTCRTVTIFPTSASRVNLRLANVLLCTARVFTVVPILFLKRLQSAPFMTWANKRT